MRDNITRLLIVVISVCTIAIIVLGLIDFAAEGVISDRTMLAVVFAAVIGNNLRLQLIDSKLEKLEK